jgi:hypothetical protein
MGRRIAEPNILASREKRPAVTSRYNALSQGNMQKSPVLLVAVLCVSAAALPALGQTAPKAPARKASTPQSPAAKGAAPKAAAKKSAAKSSAVMLFPVKVDDKYGYIDRTGKLVLPVKYRGASRFSEGLAAVQLEKAGKVGFIDATGKMVLEPEYDLADPFSQGLSGVLLGASWGYMDKSGKLAIPTQFPSVTRFSKDGVAAVAVRQGPLAVGFGYINRKGEFLNDRRYLAAMPSGEGLCAVRSFGEQYSFIDLAGKTVIPPQFITAGEFSEGLAPVEVTTPEGLRWGYINRKGEITVPARFFKAVPFSEGKAAVQDETGKWGFIDSTGKMVIPARFDQASTFQDGLAEVYVDRFLGYIDQSGKYVWEPKERKEAAAPPKPGEK